MALQNYFRGGKAAEQHAYMPHSQATGFKLQGRKTIGLDSQYKSIIQQHLTVWCCVPSLSLFI